MNPHPTLPAKSARLMPRTLAASCAAVFAMSAQAVIVVDNQGSPNAAQYYSAQAYAELKSAAPNYNQLDAGGRVADAAAPMAPIALNGNLSGGGSAMSYTVGSALTGFLQVRANASMTVSNAIANGGYNAVASRGSRTQGYFSATGAQPGRADFNFNLSGSASSPYGQAFGRLDFLAREFTPGGGSYFDVFGAAALNANTPGTHTFTYTGSFANPLDILFYGAAGVVIQDGATVPGGAGFSAFADFASTFDLASIDLFDTLGNRIDEWTLTDMASEQVVFDQGGRVALPPIPEPGTLALFTLGMAAVLRRAGLRRLPPA